MFGMTGMLRKIRSDNYYVIKDNKIYYSMWGDTKTGKKVEGADPKTFKVLYKWYAKDKTRAYFQEKVIPNADPNSFVVLSPKFVKDNNRVYYGNMILRNADTKTFEVFEENKNFARDKKKIYYDQEIINDADRETFRPCGKGHDWARDKNQTYCCFLKAKPHIRRIKSKNPNSLEFVEKRYPNYAKDDQYVYYFGRRIKKIDARTFEHLGRNYYKDKNSIYYETESINADIETFRAIDQIGYYTDYGTDKNTGYHFGMELSSSEIKKNKRINETFEQYFQRHPELKNYWWFEKNESQTTKTKLNIVSNGLAEDGKNIYLCGLKLDKIDPKTCEIIYSNQSEEEYGKFNHIAYLLKDSDGIYAYSASVPGAYLGSTNSKLCTTSAMLFANGHLEDADPKTFKRVEGRYFKDKKRAWYVYSPDYGSIREIKKADVKTFEVLDKEYSKDLNHVFYEGKWLMKANSKTFKVLGYGYAKDKNQVFCGNEIVKNIDVNTAQPLKRYTYPQFIKDKNQIFCNAKVYRNKKIDVGTLKMIADDFAVDEKHLYYLSYDRFVPMTDVDVTTVKTTGLKVKDKKYTYDINLLRLAIVYPNPKRTVSDVKYGDIYLKSLKDKYYTDGKNIYYIDSLEYENRHNKIENVNIKNFKVLEHGYATDGEILFWNGKVVKNANPKRFVVLTKDIRQPACGHDDKRFYFNASSIDDMDIKSLKILKDGYLKDKNEVRYCGYTVQRADKSSFEVIGDGYARDKRRLYYRTDEIK